MLPASTLFSSAKRKAQGKKKKKSYKILTWIATNLQVREQKCMVLVSSMATKNKDRGIFVKKQTIQ